MNTHNFLCLAVLVEKAQWAAWNVKNQEWELGTKQGKDAIGLWRFWRPDGILLQECTFGDGERDSLPAQFFDAQGRPVERLDAFVFTPDQLRTERKRLATLDRHDPEAIIDLSWAYHDGDGIAKDLSQARYWMEQAATLGSTRAINGLGLYWLWGEMFGNKRLMFYDERDSTFEGGYGQSFAYFKKAAEKGYPNGMANLATHYLHGWGTPRDLTQAEAWGLKARELGGNNTAQLLADVCKARGDLGARKPALFQQQPLDDFLDGVDGHSSNE